MGYRAKFRTVIATLAVLVLGTGFTTQSQAAQITGIADENLEQWSPAAWQATTAAGIQHVRHIVEWDTAYHQGKINEVSSWISSAKARGLKVLISFGHNYGPYPSTSAYLNAVAAFRQLFPQVTEYTAWNEPNHKPGGNPWSPANDPETAAGYWVNLNLVCNLPQYGPQCTVAAGDFLDPNGDGSHLNNYINKYKEQLAKSGVSPSVWAVHPYTAAETGDPAKLTANFMNLTENKPVWFTEVGGMICRPGSGPTGGGGLSPESFQNQTAQRLLSLIDYYGGRIHRTYYYSMAGANGVEEKCNYPYVWDSNLLSKDVPRPAYYTLFGKPADRVFSTGDFSGDGKSDVIVRKPEGNLFLFRGNGAGGWVTGNPERIGIGWEVANLMVGPGDLTSDGKSDVLITKANGDLVMFRGNGASGWLTGNPELVGIGWNLFSEVIAPGDFTGDGKADLMGRKPNGDLLLYRGNGGGGWIGPETIGSGWNMFDTVIGPGDFTGDGRSDVMGRTPSGQLYLYRGNGAGGWLTGNGELIGVGWHLYNLLVTPRDFTGDGKVDVLGRKANGDLVLHRGDGAGGWQGSSGQVIGIGW